MDALAKPQLLCVDDEPRVIEGLALILRKDYEVHTASSPEEALLKLKELGNLAVVISDMRMPKMDGAAFLQEVKRRQPDASRILLTGQADREEAMRAVNLGQVFRILAKPCPVDQLKAAIEAGVAQHRLANAERSILRETLLGCIKALMEVLALANPVAFGRADQIKRRVMELASRLGTPDFWQLEAAALLSQLGYVALSPGLVEKSNRGNFFPFFFISTYLFNAPCSRIINHLHLGIRFGGTPPDDVIALARGFDVYSMNKYRWAPPKDFIDTRLPHPGPADPDRRVPLRRARARTRARPRAGDEPGRSAESRIRTTWRTPRRIPRSSARTGTSG